VSRLVLTGWFGALEDPAIAERNDVGADSAPYVVAGCLSHFVLTG
jgi:hypothetical protein